MSCSSCRFGRWGWGMAGFLAVYVLFMHSTFWTERKQMCVRWQTTWQQEWQAERAQLTEHMQTLVKEHLALLQAAPASPVSIAEYPRKRWGRQR